MQRTILSLSLIGTALATNAQLAPGTEAPLYQHLLEVNREWSAMDPTPMDGDRMVRFENEAQRIATHLHMVRERLIERGPRDPRPEVAAQRSFLLDRLRSYADRGRFPTNTVLPRRNPVFIDPTGTACAVGQLMIESGKADLALRIHDEMNLAYVHDMHRSDVDDWAVSHGFTEDELAWIQPGYPPGIPWTTVGTGTDGRVTELLRTSNGELIVAGEFLIAGGLYATHVATWDGAAYGTMGSLDGEVNAAIEFNGDIYLGGVFGGGVYDLARWTGSSWQLSTAFASKSAAVTDLHIHDGVLHAAGSISGFAGTSYGVKRLMNGNWEDIGQQLNGPINAVETFDGGLVIGGAFTGDFFETDTTLAHVARLSGPIWEQLGDGLNGTVNDLLVHQDQLHAAGDCLSELGSYFGLARIAAGATYWEPLMPNITDYVFSPLDGLVGIKAMLPDPDGVRIHLGGDLYVSDGMITGNGLATYNGAPDAVTPLGDFLGPVEDLELFGASELIAGGASEALANIASTDLSLGTEEPSGSAATLIAWPNPAVDRITLEGFREPGNYPYAVIDAAGREVMTGRMDGNRALNIASITAGTYTVRIRTNEGTRSVNFVKR